MDQRSNGRRMESVRQRFPKELQDLIEHGAVWVAEASSGLSRNVLSRGVLSDKVLSGGAALAEAVYSQEGNSGENEGQEFVSLVLEQGGGRRGALHEWYLENEVTFSSQGEWYAPVWAIASLLRTVAVSPGGAPQSTAAETGSGTFIAWVGRSVWPTPHQLDKIWSDRVPAGKESCPLVHDWRSHTLFIDPPSKEKCVWAALELLGNTSVAAVVVNGKGFSATVNRRLQRAVRVANGYGFILRPPWERHVVSAAATRWHLVATPQEGVVAHLIRARGMRVPRMWKFVGYGEGACVAREITDDSALTLAAETASRASASFLKRAAGGRRRA